MSCCDVDAGGKAEPFGDRARFLGAASTTRWSFSLVTNSPGGVLALNSLSLHGTSDPLFREDVDNVLVLEPSKLVGSPSDGGNSRPSCGVISEETSGQGPNACATGWSVGIIWETALAAATRSSADARRDETADGSSDIRLATRPSSRNASRGTSVNSGVGGEDTTVPVSGVSEALWYGERRGGEYCVAVARAAAMALAMAAASGDAGALGGGGRRRGPFSSSSSAAICLRKLKWMTLV